MQTDDPDKLSAALVLLETERQRRLDEKVAAGDVLCAPPVVVGDPTSIADAKAAKVSELRKAGETREIVFGQPLYDPDGQEVDRIAVIATGVPRTGRDKLPDDYVPWKPDPSKRYTPSAPASYARAAPTDAFDLPAESDPTPFRVTTEPPPEHSCGRVEQGTWTIAGNIIRVRDMEGRLFYLPARSAKATILTTSRENYCARRRGRMRSTPRSNIRRRTINVT
jgi:hypothetical protein